MLWRHVLSVRGVAVIFKSSFDKANRTAAGSPRGVGLDAGLEILAAVKTKTGLPVLTDIHTADQSGPVAQVVDCLQIPAFLCRQTDLLVAAAATGRPVNVKKGQFLAPWDMRHVVEKLRGPECGGLIVTERGVSFGYNTLVSDMRALPILAESTRAPVVFDATHSVQQPGGRDGSSGGEGRFAPLLARAAAAMGVAGIFLECHDDPDHAPSDGPVMVPLADLPALLATLKEIDSIIKQ